MGILNFFRRKNGLPRDVHKEELPDLTKDLQEDPFNDQIQVAVQLANSGRQDDAERILRQIVEEKAGHVRAWLILAEYFTRRDALGRALYCYEQVIQYQPTNKIVRQKVARLQGSVRHRPDYLWEYNQEIGLF